MRLSNFFGIVGRRVARRGFSRSRGLIFLIGHMRSLSTLLSHQIGSNPDVAGYIEAHQKYRNWLDLLELEHKIDLAGGHSPRGRFLFDKVLHPHEIRDAILQREDLKIILMVREPEATVRSIVKISSGGHDTISEAADYYSLRLAQLREILERRSGRVLYLEAEALLDDSAATLAEISEYLGLVTPLTERYERFPMTGTAKFGDPSQWISAGTIVRNRGSEKIEIMDGSRMAALWRAYDDFRRYAHANAESAILRKVGISKVAGARGAKENPRDRERTRRR